MCELGDVPAFARRRRRRARRRSSTSAADGRDRHHRRELVGAVPASRASRPRRRRGSARARSASGPRHSASTVSIVYVGPSRCSSASHGTRPSTPSHARRTMARGGARLGLDRPASATDRRPRPSPPGRDRVMARRESPRRDAPLCGGSNVPPKMPTRRSAVPRSSRGGASAALAPGHCAPVASRPGRAPRPRRRADRARAADRDGSAHGRPRCAPS